MGDGIIQNSMVSDLIDKNDDKWKMELIRSTFEKDEGDLILQRLGIGV